MRKFFIAALILVVSAGGSAAIAGTVSLVATLGQVNAACIGSGGTTTAGVGKDGFGCKTDKGEVECDKTGKCTGTCNNCSNAVSRPADQILLNARPTIPSKPAR